LPDQVPVTFSVEEEPLPPPPLTEVAVVGLSHAARPRAVSTTSDGRSRIRIIL
jgi:hypothetical protein